MINKTLYIHIGTHKTGTSALQRSLLLNSQLLKENNISFLEYSLRHNAHILRNIDNNNENLLYEEKTNLEKKINEITEDNIILSCEEYFGNLDVCYADTKEMARKLSFVTSSYKCRIIVYIRRQDEFIESSYTQYIKQGASYSFKKFLKVYDIYQFNWFKLIGMFVDFFGKDSVCVRPYEKNQLFESDVIKDFYKTIGIKSLSSLKKHDYSNYGYSRSGLEIARIYNSIYKNNYSKKTHFKNVLQSRMRKKKYSSFNFFKYEDREKILEYYDVSNKKMAVEFLHRQDGILFFDSVQDYKNIKHRKNRLMMADVFDAVSSLFLSRIKSKALTIWGRFVSIITGLKKSNT